MTAEDFSPHTATPKVPPQVHPAGDSNASGGAAQSPRRAVGVYDRPARSFRVRALTITSMIGVLVVLALLWILGIFIL
jgi:hypothetical protein